MQILIIEDSQSMAQALSEILQQQGHQTTWLFGVQSLTPFVGSLKDGTTVPVDLSAFDLVFQDGDLVGSPFQGVDIVKALACQGVKFAANSTMPDLNNEMVSLGALVAACKPVMMVALQAGAITAQGITSDTKASKDTLAQLQATKKANKLYAEAWQAVETRLKELMKIEFGL